MSTTLLISPVAASSVYDFDPGATSSVGYGGTAAQSRQLEATRDVGRPDATAPSVPSATAAVDPTDDASQASRAFAQRQAQARELQLRQQQEAADALQAQDLRTELHVEADDRTRQTQAAQATRQSQDAQQAQATQRAQLAQQAQDAQRTQDAQSVQTAQQAQATQGAQARQALQTRADDAASLTQEAQLAHQQAAAQAIAAQQLQQSLQRDDATFAPQFAAVNVVPIVAYTPVSSGDAAEGVARISGVGGVGDATIEARA